MDYHNYDILDYCKHLILWENCDSGLEYPDVINDLEWFTRMSVFPFRIWDVLCEVINNDQLPEGCEVKFRTFYVMDYIVFVFGNDPKTLVDVVLERTKEYIRQYHAQYPLKGKDFDRFSDILAHPSRIRFLRVLLTPQRAF